MSNHLEFLKSKGVPEHVFVAQDTRSQRDLARALGWVAPSVDVSIVEYTTVSTKKTGMYLNVAMGKSKPQMFKLCEGTVLTKEAFESLEMLTNAIADLLP